MSADRTAPVKEKVQRYLADIFGTVQIDRDGDFTFRQGSARVFLRVEELGDDKTVVAVWAPTNNDVPPSAELFRYLATHNAYRFGSLLAVERGDKVNVVFKHTLLGDTLDPDELMIAAALVAGTADKVDDEIKQKFGGRIFHED